MSNLPDWKTTPPAERDRLLAELCAIGLSAGQISDRFMNCSRSAVIGRVHRMKLKLHGHRGNWKYPPEPGEAKSQVARKAKAKAPAKKPSARATEVTSWRGANNPHYTDVKARAEQRATSKGLSPHLVAGEAPKPIDAEVPASRNLALADLTNHTCRWPHGDPLNDDFGFCGNGTTETGPYCKYHSRLAFTPATERQRASQKASERIR